MQLITPILMKYQSINLLLSERSVQYQSTQQQSSVQIDLTDQ